MQRELPEGVEGSLCFLAEENVLPPVIANEVVGGPGVSGPSRERFEHRSAVSERGDGGLREAYDAAHRLGVAPGFQRVIVRANVVSEARGLIEMVLKTDS